MGHEPREFDASRGLVLTNLSEILVRQLEHKWAESEARQSSVQLMRSLACYEEAFLFLDTSRQGDWRVLHMNLAASKLLGRHILLTLTPCRQAGLPENCKSMICRRIQAENLGVYMHVCLLEQCSLQDDVVCM